MLALNKPFSKEKNTATEADVTKSTKGKQTARESVAAATGFVEFLTDHFNDSLGHIFIKASPILAPIPSGIAIAIAMFAYFVMITGNWLLSVALSVVVAFVVEGLGFAAVDAKNKIEAHNRSLTNAVDHLDYGKAQRAINTYFIVTVGAIFFFETLPSWSAWLWGIKVDGHAVSLIDALRATAPLVFPFFANIGASIYSLMDVLNKIEGSKKAAAADNTNSLLAQIEALELSLRNTVDTHKDEIATMKDRFAIDLQTAQNATADKIKGEFAVIVTRLETELLLTKQQSEVVARNGEMVTAMAVEAAKQEVAKNNHDRTVQLETELRYTREKSVELAETVERLTNQLTRQNRQPAPVANSPKNRQPELTETEIDYCNQIVVLVEENDIKTWRDLESLTGWSQKTCERYGKLAKDNGYVEKVNGLYRKA